MRPWVVVIAGALLAPASSVLAQPERSASEESRISRVDERRAYLDRLLGILPESPEFNAWLKSSGELPPDFASLPRHRGLPDPLRFLNGEQVRTLEDWDLRRKEVQQLFARYVHGTYPPRPKIDRVVEIATARGEGQTIRSVELRFGPAGDGRLRVELTIPDGAGPFPVFLASIGAREWAKAATRRGYLAALFSASDRQDDAAQLANLYPENDFALLPRRAWAGTIVLDLLETVPQADMKRVGIIGHSREAKAALICAGLDPRITAVVSSSSGVGGTLPFRLASEPAMGEGIETTTRRFFPWFHPRLRFFTGREDRLPVDGNLLVSLVAPRACLISYAVSDHVTNAWGEEQCYESALKVYRLLGQPGKLGMRWRVGYHAVKPGDVEAFIDWFDLQFGRSTQTWRSDRLFDYDFDRWIAQSGERIDPTTFPIRRAADILTGASGEAITTLARWEEKAMAVRSSVRRLLGEQSPSASRHVTGAPSVSPPGFWTADGFRVSMNPLSGWPEAEMKSFTVESGIRVGGSTMGELYRPANAAGRIPVVIWLPGYNTARGYQWTYRTDLTPILALVKGGYAVFAIDYIGTGRRIFEAKGFHERFPGWSELGKIVEDTRSAIETLQASEGIDPERIYLFGYALGGSIALHAAALDVRIKGLVTICGFTPMRSDTTERGAGGIGRYSKARGLIPRLGFFLGHEERIPYDYNELLAAIAPRPVLVIQPRLDSTAHSDDVHAAVAEARRVYALSGAGDKLKLEEPWDYNRLPAAAFPAIVDWMHSHLPSSPNRSP